MSEWLADLHGVRLIPCALRRMIAWRDAPLFDDFRRRSSTPAASRGGSSSAACSTCRGEHVREDAVSGAAPGWAPPAHAARAARLPGRNCNLVLPPTHPEADAGFVIMEQVEYPPMSGTNTICVTTVLLETGMLPMREPVTELTLEAPAGLIRVRAECRNGKVTRVTFRNVPAFAVHLDAPIEVRPGHGQRRRRLGRDVLRDRRRRRRSGCGSRRTRGATSPASAR